ncbi:Gfo/Idh/MocA family oxidoreductase [Saccharopolyspora karakumensis]|uniref:Gfo/Idh/MocA family oxidoreductase n=1 Tax=Saccharopolyspora karakumensis TaxID=2530386 RepID=A0A4R5BI11_9PSEU|nr:Gfo/Idh/MocA family oxidoreductase [Saccharopolyspora karakumensis]TDD86161.1 Gfo/Idh/MocA family oxidoreductase [Saccharopolyspora karakumensis]
MITAAVIGCGDVSAVHLDAIAALEDVELVAVCDTDPAALTTTAERCGVAGFADHRALLEAVRPDVAHVCTPHHQHAPVALDLLDAGVHVLVEKPLAHTLDEAERLVEAAERSRSRVGVCFQNRYNATAQAAREVLDSGELGSVLGATATVLWTRTPDYYLAKPWRGRWATAGGGLLINQAIHTLDLVQWLVGDVVEVQGRASTRRHLIEVEDTAEMLLTHGGGARSLVFGSLANVVHAPVTIDITAERGALAIRGDLTITHTDGRVRAVAERRSSSNGRSYWGASHEALIGDFYARLGDDEPFWISPREATKALRILTDVYAQSDLAEPAHAVSHSHAR